MAKRSQKYIKLPWTGGVNDSVDSGVLPDSDLVQADNVTIGVSGSRLKREGISYFDQLTVPTISSATRSGSTVTVTFATAIDSASNDIFVVGEGINVTSSDSQYTNATATVVSIPSTTTLTYTTAGAITPTAASATITSITRTASIVGIHDFWYYDASSDAKNQYILAVNSDAQVFRYTVNGERIQLTNKTNAVTLSNAGDVVNLTAHGYSVGDSIGFSSLTNESAGAAINTVYYVATVPTADTFTLASQRGGSALVLTADFSGVLVSPLFTTSINSASFLTMNEKCLIAFDGIENFPKVFDPATSTTLIRGALGACPNAKFICEKPHLGRAWMNDKEITEQLYYSGSYDFDKWNGYDDSGVLNIGFGDGDPDGINAIHPPFKGTIFCTKRNSVYRIDGSSPEDFQIIQVSNGIGGVGHNAVASVDLDDVMYMSYKGIHSLAATNAYGAFQGTFLSEKIQTAFSNWTAGRLKYTSARYIPTLNSVFFSVASSDYDNDNQDSLWVYNIKFKEWHRWPNIEAKSLGFYDNGGRQILLMGSYNGRISEAQNGDYTDYTDTAIQYLIKTGTIYPDNNPDSIKAFKRIGFLFRPKGDFTFTVRVKIDNFAIQPLVFTQTAGGARLGTDFYLGLSALAFSNVLAPHMLPIDGYGRGLTVTIENNAADQQVEIYGLVLEYEVAGDAQENIGSQDL